MADDRELEKTTDDLSEAAARARHPAARPPADDAGQLVAGFEDLAGALRGAPGARDLPQPASALLDDLAGDLRGLQGIARGPIGV